MRPTAVEAGRYGRVARHLRGYPTWRSLVVELEVGDAEAVEIGVALLSGVTRG